MEESFLNNWRNNKPTDEDLDMIGDDKQRVLRMTGKEKRREKMNEATNSPTKRMWAWAKVSMWRVCVMAHGPVDN